MKDITVDKAKLIQALKENKEKHDTIFKEAEEAYWVQAAKIAKIINKKVKNKEQISFSDFNVEFPSNFSKEYDRVIDMLNMAIETTVSLSQSEFDKYIRNNWEWKRGFVDSTLSFIKNKALVSSF